MKLAIIGSRSFTDYEFFLTELGKLLAEKNIVPTEIVSGGAKGADSLGKRYAIERNLVLTEFFPDWDKFGKGAGFIRNEKIVSRCDVVVAFWDGKSAAQSLALNLPRKQGSPSTS